MTPDAAERPKRVSIKGEIIVWLLFGQPDNPPDVTLEAALRRIVAVDLPDGYEGDWQNAYEGARELAREALGIGEAPAGHPVDCQCGRYHECAS